MLSALHNRAYQDFLILLTNFDNSIRNTSNRSSRLVVTQEFASLQQWFEENIGNLDEKEIEAAYIPRWQAVQREIEREFKLLITDILFLASARREATINKRTKSANDRISKLTSYCQGILQEAQP